MCASPEADRVGVPRSDADFLIKPLTWTNEGAVRAICLIAASLINTAFVGFLDPILNVLTGNQREFEASVL